MLLCVEKPLFQSPSTVEFIRKLLNEQYRVICLIADEYTLSDTTLYVDLDFTLFELQFITDFKLDDFIACYGRNDLRYSMEVSIDPNNTGEISKAFSSKLREQLFEGESQC